MRSRSPWAVLLLAAVAIIAVGAVVGRCGLVGAGVSNPDDLSQRAAGTPVLRVSGVQRRHAIAPGFIGLSIEFSALPAYAGRDPTAVDPVFEQLIRNLTADQSPSLRIGGDSTAHTWVAVPGLRRPAGVTYTSYTGASPGIGLTATD